MKRKLLCLMAAIAILLGPAKLAAQAITEDFNDITTLPGTGWFQQNNSAPVGTNPVWFQGNPPVNGGPFNSFSGAANAYVACNFNSTAGGTGTISNWLVAPNRTFKNGDVITFYTRKYDIGTDYPDRMEVRLSTNGASTNVGTGAAATGDFTTLLLSINPTLVAGGYPRQWTQYTITISGLPAPTSGRMAFRYFVTSAGPTGSNSDYIGVDEYRYIPYVCPTFTMTASGALAGGTAGTSYSTSLTQTGALGAPTFAVVAGALPPGLTLAANGTISGTPTATGTFNFSAVVSDNSGCSSSSTSYSITIVCPTGGASLSAFPAICNNASAFTLTQGSPAGGTYSGTGVSGGSFDPSAGTQSITYELIDPYGCLQSASSTFNVNIAPTVTQSAFADACNNGSAVTLAGGSPAGGTYSGTNVSAGSFDPSGGTQTITYTFTDGNGCTNSDTEVLTVNTAPTVTQTPFMAACDNGAIIALTGGSPVGGTYSGTGVVGSNFDPSVGTQTLTYTFTDGNGCSNEVDEIFTVNTAPTVTQSSFTAACGNGSPIVLSGGSPAGGTYSGTGVTAGNFNPSAGTQPITYSFTDGNGCTGTTTETFNVNAAPTANLSAGDNDPCVTYGAVTLTGSPSGGVYSGSGVTGNQFNPGTAGVGTFNLTYIYTDGNGCMDTANTSMVVAACLGIDDQNAAVLFTLYPNPTTEFINLQIQTTLENSNLKMEVIGLDGKIHVSKEILVSTGNHIETIQVSNLASGNYMVKLQDKEGNTVTHKFVKH